MASMKEVVFVVVEATFSSKFIVCRNEWRGIKRDSGSLEQVFGIIG